MPLGVSYSFHRVLLSAVFAFLLSVGFGACSGSSSGPASEMQDISGIETSQSDNASDSSGANEDEYSAAGSDAADSDNDGTLDEADTDDDGDGISDTDDTDDDGDGVEDGDDADADSDGDGVPNGEDDLPDDPTESVDSDGDGVGDRLDSDDDGDGVSDTDDTDDDGDGVPDTEDSDFDTDGDGVSDGEDAFPGDATEFADSDGDGMGDRSDADDDGDGISDTDDTDDDGDGVPDTEDSDFDTDGDGTPDARDAFPEDATETTDTDGDGTGNNADTDDDDDGVADTEDASPYVAEEDDGGTSEETPADSDGDGVADTDDAFPYLATETGDVDGDGVGDNTDADDDNDGVADTDDAFPYDETEYRDTDGDGSGDTTDADDDGDSMPDATDTDDDGDGTDDTADADTDTDGDGIPDERDAFPADAAETTDTDGDLIGNEADTDDDGDGTEDANDAFPLDATETADFDGDGDGDNFDFDDDNDNVMDWEDAFPNDATETTDTDGDGIGDNTETDDDNDGVPDVDDLGNTITVTTASDVIADDGLCSLREAIRNANNDNQQDNDDCTTGQAHETIVVPAGTYTFALAGTSEYDSATGSLDLNDSVTITGDGSAATVIDADQLDRVLRITGSGSYELEGLTFRNGLQEATDNNSAYGGGIYIRTAISQEMEVTVRDCAVTSNLATSPGGSAYGGGFYVGITGYSTLDLTIENTAVSSNTLFSVAENAYGGGLYASTTTSATFNFSIDESTFADNTAVTDGSAGSSFAHGAGISASGSGVYFELTDSTFSGNAATGAPAYGGALYLGNHANATVTNSTFASNSVTDASGSSNAYGGGVYVSETSSASFYNATVSGNEATSAATAANSAYGGGVFGLSGATMSLVNSVLFDNDVNGADRDCYGTFASVTATIIGDASDCTFTSGTPLGDDPVLGVLGDNGGPTQTMSLGTDSAAINAAGGDCLDSDNAVITLDQRGEERSDGLCDIGAYEAESPDAGYSGGDGSTDGDNAIEGSDNAVVGDGETGTDNATGSDNATSSDNGTSGGGDSGGGTGAEEGASGVTITVTTTTDIMAADGLCSLREALINANTDSQNQFEGCEDCSAGSGADIITLPGGTYTITLTDLGTTGGDFNITGSVTINGAEDNSTIIDGADLDRVMSVEANLGDTVVTLNNLTLQNGKANGVHGGGLFVESEDGHALSLTLNDCTLIQNEIYTSTGVVSNLKGGGFYAKSEGGGAAEINLNNTVISGNTISIARNAYGGGVYVDALGGDFSFTMDAVTVSNNALTSTIGSAVGGGVYFRSLTGGESSFLIDSSTISGNEASSGGYAYGGGVYATAPVVMVNSTITGNTAATTGVPLPQGAGMVFAGTADVGLYNITVASNSSTNSSGTPQGSGVYVSSGTVNLFNSIIFDNDVNGTTDRDCYGTFASVTASIVGDTTDCTFTSGTPLGDDPVLGALADNGGPTQTMSLASDSAAIDAGTTCLDSDNAPLTVDQRGEARSDGLCDLGAYEAAPADTDGDGEPDYIDADDDGDGTPDSADAFPNDPSETLDSDNDLVGDNADLDDNGDGVLDDLDSDGVMNEDDNCPDTANADQADGDGDGAGDSCDAFPSDATETTDEDGDGSGANADCDDDDATVYPNADETFDFVDEDCDGTVDNVALADVEASIYGASGARFGTRLATGDFNCDGYDDILASSYTYSSSKGRAWIIFGGSTRWSSAVAASSEADVIINGETAGDKAGYAIASADYNDDTCDDILIGAPGVSSSTGRVYMIYGQPRGMSGTYSLADVAGGSIPFLGAVFNGEVAGDQAGFSVANAGDIDNDGIDDILIGAPYNDDRGTSSGKVYLLYGASGTAVGNPVTAHTGSDTLNTTAFSDMVQFRGNTSSFSCGYAVSGAGDFNDDNYDDVLLSCPAESKDTSLSAAGVVYLYFGGSGATALSASNVVSPSNGATDAYYYGGASGTSAGETLSPAGDVNRDGYADFLVGADNYSSNTGRAYLVFGKASFAFKATSLDNATTSLIRITGSSSNEYTGYALAGGKGRDVDGDRYADIVIGAYGVGGALYPPGRSYLVYGDNATLDASFSVDDVGVDIDGATFTGHSAAKTSTSGDASGKAVALGDLDNDGYDDIVIAAPNRTIATVANSGEIFIIYGQKRPWTLTPLILSPFSP